MLICPTSELMIFPHFPNIEDQGVCTWVLVPLCYSEAREISCVAEFKTMDSAMAYAAEEYPWSTVVDEHREKIMVPEFLRDNPPFEGEDDWEDWE